MLGLKLIHNDKMGIVEQTFFTMADEISKDMFITDYVTSPTSRHDISISCTQLISIAEKQHYLQNRAFWELFYAYVCTHAN